MDSNQLVEAVRAGQTFPWSRSQAENLQEFLSTNVMQRALGRALKEIEDASHYQVLNARLTSEEGRLEGIRAQAHAKGALDLVCRLATLAEETEL